MSTIHPLRKAIRSSYEHRRTTWWSAALMTAMLGTSGLAVAACSPCSPCKNKCKAGQHCKAGCNPCAAKNPCATKNPCAAKNPCATKGCNPCAVKGCNPCAAAGKCGAKPNPCAAKKVSRPANYQSYEGNPCKLMALGEKLFNDPSLSSNGLSCSTCHNNGASYNATFANAYPHSVAMARDIFGLDSVHLDEMVQICMVQPMASEPLAWDSEELAALTTYMGKVQKQLAGNPCALKGGKCGACNPCAGKNPCATKNPCAAKNPCSAKVGKSLANVAA
ncbi:Di-haem cytochrome c peroxidase [Marinobacter antarcticus]|uniref:Di-haem cytochrome c peroxidase n=1 Tax=Marinobacter antarcticus TaxID=564117 RepID=A0A1M6PQI2_9GAMM|nr:cytochrome c peroxidase [Marinobacter antarcticus]SHK10205.1 Di-haem cytochrome c peroxidase [Marinobacter antarcticus]